MTVNGHETHMLPPRPRLTSVGPESVRVSAPAKINLDLLVGPVRGDGFHAVDSVVVKVTLYDQIEMRCRHDGRITFDCQGADCGPDETNLALRAASLLSQRRPDLGADVRLRKAVPPGAGLGGGSSDAAAVLIALNELWRLDLGVGELASSGAPLGSDVPLFFGPRCCRVTGRGEIVEPAAVHDFAAVLILTGVPCATAEVYGAYDALAAKIDRQIDLKVIADEPPSSWRGLLRNDLAPAARRVNVELDSAWRVVAESIVQPVCLTGAGSAMFVLCDDEHEAAEVRGSLPRQVRENSLIVGPNPW